MGEGQVVVVVVVVLEVGGRVSAQHPVRLLHAKHRLPLGHRRRLALIGLSHG